MSFDLIVWTGSPATPSRFWRELAKREPSTMVGLPRERLAAALRDVFGVDVRMSPGSDGSAAFQAEGRGWECWVDGAWTSIACDWSVASEPTAIALLTKAAHMAGCSVYDPQFGAYWPVSLGLPEACEDVWTAAVFDEGFVYEDEDEEGHVPSRPMRLCPEGVSPIDRTVWVHVHVVEPGALLRVLVSRRASLYRDRFPGWKITVELGGPGASVLACDDVTRWLKRSKAISTLARESGRPSVAVVVLGHFDASELPARFDVCPFELVPIPWEEQKLASIFGELVASLVVIVPTRHVTDRPETLRAALRALHHELVVLSNGAAVQFADPSKGDDACIGANLAWVEALVGLTPSEPIREILAEEVSPCIIEDLP